MKSNAGGGEIAVTINSQQFEDSVRLEWPRNPFPGLRPFREEECLIFYGRNSQKDEVLARLNQSQLVFVTGPSGCGKSSLIKAGVLPALRAGLLTKAGYRWKILQMRPGRHPLSRLADEFESARATQAVAPENGRDVTNLIKTEESALWLAAESIAPSRGASGTRPPERLLLVIDQFEEIFGPQIQDPSDAGRFIRLLVRFAERPHPNLFLILTMRSDYLGQCANFEGLAECINRSQFLTPVLTEEELGQAISRPAEDYNGEVEPTLVDQIIHDMRSGFAYHPDSLPLMQHALLWLWSDASRRSSGNDPPRPSFDEGGSRTRLTLAMYQENGGIEGILNRHAEDILKEAVGTSKKRRKIAQELFRRLSERDSEGRYRRSPTSADNICRTAACTLEDLQHIVKPFEHPDVCFIEQRRSTNTDEALVDISHESLIRQWHTAKNWADTEADKVRYFRNLVSFAKAWEEKDRSPDFLKRKGELEVIQTRWQNETPTAYWARRYGFADEFPRVEEYLHISAETDREEKTREERERLRESLRQRNRNMGIAAFLFFLCIVISGLYIKHKWDNENHRAQLWAVMADEARKIYGPARGLLVALQGIRDKLPELPNMQRASYRALAELREQRILRDEEAPTIPVQSLDFDPNGRPLLLTASQDGALRFWDPETGRLIDRAHVGGSFLTARWRPHASELFVSARDVKSHFLVPCSHANLRSFFPQCGPEASADIKREFSTDVGSGVFSADGRWIVTGTRFVNVRIWDVTDLSQPIKDFGVTGAFNVAAAFSQDSKWVAVGTSSGEIRVFDLAGILPPPPGAPPALASSDAVILGSTQAGAAHVATSLAFHPFDSNVLLATYQDGAVEAWSIAEKKSNSLSTIPGWAMQGIFNKEGSWIAVAHEDRAVRLWPLRVINSKEHVRPQILRGHESWILAVAYNTDGTKLASGSSDGTVRIWWQRPALAPTEIESSESDSLSGEAQVFPRGKEFVLKYGDREILLTTPTNPEPASPGAKEPVVPIAAAVSASGKDAVVAPSWGRPYLFNLAAKEYIVMLPVRPQAWRKVGFLRDPKATADGVETHVVAITEDGRKKYIWPYFKDLVTLERFADHRIPFDGSTKRLEIKNEVMCRIENKPDSECPTGDDSPPE